MSMYLSLSQLEEKTPEANIKTPENETRSSFYEGKKASVFLSHKHSEIAQLKRIACLLEQLCSWVYVDWLDPTMPQKTCGKTAENIKKKIIQYDKFILVATENAISSKPMQLSFYWVERNLNISCRRPYVSFVGN